MLEVFYTIGIDNALVNIVPNRNQTLFQFINAVDMSGKDVPAWSSMSDIVSWVEVWAERIQWNEVAPLCKRQLDCFTSALLCSHVEF